ncbi:uncharacterized [Tachysurus ichikawai]
MRRTEGERVTKVLNEESKNEGNGHLYQKKGTKIQTEMRSMDVQREIKREESDEKKRLSSMKVNETFRIVEIKRELEMRRSNQKGEDES